MLWFLRGIRKGVVTSRYPAERDPSAAALPSPPVFRGDLLTTELADRLAAACPGALTRDGSELVLDLGTCTGCGVCREIGGDAVAPSGEFELATRHRNALVKRIQIGAAR
jgi:formate hydrogenlyase subunit 6/NADH:ubiquinone oxidoreductase subunit I